MQQPDIVFIVLDTQRADRLSCYGHTKPTSPNLDRFAQNAVLFESAISPAQWTIPSHASMFTGLYPTAHQVTQSNQRLGPDTPHLVEQLQAAGYETVGFCNNPLVGILDNGFRRGFDVFYNYGGAIPNVPERPSRLPKGVQKLMGAGGRWLRQIATPIQNYFAQSEMAFSLFLYAWLTPLWSRWANFKGQNARSAADVAAFLTRRAGESEKPLFLFLNLMETHLPFFPPSRFVDQFAPEVRQDKASRRAMERWNREAYRWAAPLPQGLSNLERQVLSNMYDAEVAYQDDYLGQVLDVLAARPNSDNTLIIIVGDHGDGLGEHDFFGHAFVAYHELVHVPLIIRWPRRLKGGQRVKASVSTRRVFHTVLDAAHGGSAERRALSLCEVAEGRDVEQGTAFSEIYPPLNFVRAIEHRQPELIESFRCLDVRRAIVKDAMKLIQVDDQPDELFDLAKDRLELRNVISEFSAEKASLNQHLNRIVGTVETQRDNLLAGTPLELDDDPQLLQRLRGLGYID